MSGGTLILNGSADKPSIIDKNVIGDPQNLLHAGYHFVTQKDSTTRGNNCIITGAGPYVDEPMLPGGLNAIDLSGTHSLARCIIRDNQYDVRSGDVVFDHVTTEGYADLIDFGGTFTMQNSSMNSNFNLQNQEKAHLIDSTFNGHQTFVIINDVKVLRIANVQISHEAPCLSLIRVSMAEILHLSEASCSQALVLTSSKVHANQVSIQDSVGSGTLSAIDLKDSTLTLDNSTIRGSKEFDLGLDATSRVFLRNVTWDGKTRFSGDGGLAQLESGVTLQVLNQSREPVPNAAVTFNSFESYFVLHSGPDGKAFAWIPFAKITPKGKSFFGNWTAEVGTQTVAFQPKDGNQELSLVLVEKNLPPATSTKKSPLSILPIAALGLLAAGMRRRRSP